MPWGNVVGSGRNENGGDWWVTKQKFGEILEEKRRGQNFVEESRVRFLFFLFLIFIFFCLGIF